MKDVFDVIMQHRSIRKFKKDDLPEEHLEKILQAAIHAPSSVNGQQWSVIVIRDTDVKKKFAELSGGQEWISECPIFLLFVMDYHKIAVQMKKIGIPFKNIDSIEATMVGCVDVGIAYSNAMNVAESLGYGTVPIGGIRRDPAQVIELLKLPQYVYPILGMCIGVSDQNVEKKPRLPFNAYVSQETYNADTEKLVDDYNETISQYLAKRTNGADSSTWIERVAGFYKDVYFPQVYPTLLSQGFKNDR